VGPNVAAKRVSESGCAKVQCGYRRSSRPSHIGDVNYVWMMTEHLGSGSSVSAVYVTQIVKTLNSPARPHNERANTNTRSASGMPLLEVLGDDARGFAPMECWHRRRLELGQYAKGDRSLPRGVFAPI
jgi:hypothetical protein